MTSSPDRRMSDAEALMWNVESDPWFSSTFGTIAVLEQHPDLDLLRRIVETAVAATPRLRRRVIEPPNRIGNPVWAADTEFDLDYHLRHLALPRGASSGADNRELLDELCCRLLADPLDRTRPLWQFTIIDGLSEGRSALLIKLHHTVSDGIGAIQLAEHYMSPVPDPEPPSPVDLDAIIEADRSETADSDPLLVQGLNAMADSFRRLAEGAGAAVTSPGTTVAAARSVADQLTGSTPTSPLWANRSRQRHLDTFDVELEPALTVARQLGGTLNDLFVTASLIGAAAYHEARAVEAPELTISFIISTREKGDRSTANAFAPSNAAVPANKMDAVDRFAAVHQALTSRRSDVGGGGDVVGTLAGFANLLPTQVSTGVARQQAARIDFATSNVRGAPFPVYVAGAKLLASYPVGPVAGTAFNITLMSYDGTMNVGLHTDPQAVAAPHELRDAIIDGFAQLLSAGGPA
ncbi:MAG: DUF1298 domain-containing protein [Actinomycetia bacterium]|nr:DUF1298 domain-containing protein [Actinomycetes bacterium]